MCKDQLNRHSIQKQNARKNTKIIFETFNAHVLSLYARGQRSGIVQDADGCISQTVPMYPRYCLPHAALRLDQVERHLTEYFVDRRRKAYQFN